jgi:hypothetical protein
LHLNVPERRALPRTNIAGGIAFSGTVNIDSIELEAGGSLIGTFDAIFGTQADKASGTFNAKYCDAIAPSEISATCG